MHLKADGVNPVGAPTVSLRCPECRQIGTFACLAYQNAQRYQLLPGPGAVGIYVCPKVDCHATVFIVTDVATNQVVTSYPPELIDFDPSNVPDPVREALEEAIKCHSQAAYIAAAIMVRKTLEELCHDRGAEGANLKERIAALGSTVVLPQALLDGLDDLRLLGNDAAHIESQVFNDVGKDEVEVGIEVATEVLKAVYQYDELLGRLRALKQGT